VTEQPVTELLVVPPPPESIDRGEPVRDRLETELLLVPPPRDVLDRSTPERDRLATELLVVPPWPEPADRSKPKRLPLFVLAHCTVIGAAVGLWAVSLIGTDLDAMAGLGLLNALPPTYYGAFALLLVGFAAAVTREVVSPKVLGLYVLALVLVLHATTPLLYEEPRYPWVYKHLGVIDLVATTGGVDRDIDIYNNWPGFFAANALLSSVTGVSPRSYAEWAQVFFSVVNVGVLLFALRGLTSDRRLLWTAAWLFVLANWIGQNYLAPQALGFLLSVLVLGLCLRSAPSPRRPSTRLGRWWERRPQRLESLMARGSRREFVPAPALSPRGALALGSVCYLAIVVTHQLSPVMLILSVTVLSLVGRRVPLWVPAAMVAIEAWWLTLAWPFLSENYSVFDPDLSSTGRPEGTALANAMPGYRFVVYATIAVMAVMVALTIVGLIRRVRAGHWQLAGASLAIAPVVVLAVQNYGGVAVQRAFLFALPWLAFFAAAACLPAPHTAGRALASRWRLALATCVVGICFLPAYFGRELINHVLPEDVSATVWFEEHAPTGSAAIWLAGEPPNRSTAAYPRVGLNTLASLTTRSPEMRHHRLGARDVGRVEALVAGVSERRVFLILTPHQEQYARLYGFLPKGSVAGLGRALEASSAFRLRYRRGESRVFEYVAEPESGSKP